MKQIFKVAGCQIDVEITNLKANLQKMIGYAEIAKKNGAMFAIFPECALSGYCFESKEEGLEFAEAVPGPSTEKFIDAIKKFNIHVLFGMLERDGDKLYNILVLAGPAGIKGKYRKTHLPFLGVDRFTDRGKENYKVYDVEGLRVGPIICYDGSFPEPTRCLTLLGADLVALPTNWPTGTVVPPTAMSQTRAWENNVYFMPVDRVGTERGFGFVGQSKICDPQGRILAGLNEIEEGIFYADVDPRLAREKDLKPFPGKLEYNRVKDRQPNLYSKLISD